jgi:catechol 2,3-dioxygenase-like lactoylglutathione lyase family enzyme
MDWKIELVPVPVSDVERAKRFYAEKLGFAVDFDMPVSDEMRLVQLTPPGSACSILVSSGVLETEPGSVQGVQIVVDDISGARAQLVDRGVEVSPIRRFEDGEWRDGPGGRWNSFVFFDDLDGNGWVLQERPSGD